MFLVRVGATLIFLQGLLHLIVIIFAIGMGISDPSFLTEKILIGHGLPAVLVLLISLICLDRGVRIWMGRLANLKKTIFAIVALAAAYAAIIIFLLPSDSIHTLVHPAIMAAGATLLLIGTEDYQAFASSRHSSTGNQGATL